MGDLIARLRGLAVAMDAATSEHSFPAHWLGTWHLSEEALTEAADAIRKLTAERDEWEAKANELSEWGNDLAENYDSLTADLAAARQALAEAREVLKPFAEASDNPNDLISITLAHLRRARDLYARLAVLEPPIEAQQAPLSEAEAQGGRDG